MVKIELTLLSKKPIHESVLKEMMYMLDFDVRAVQVEDTDEQYKNYDELLDHAIGQKVEA